MEPGKAARYVGLVLCLCLCLSACGGGGTGGGGSSSGSSDTAASSGGGCLYCHGPYGGPDCSGQEWRNLHGWFYNCDASGGLDLSTCTTCHADYGDPLCSDARWISIHGSCDGSVKPEDKGLCARCHALMPPICGNPAWEQSHAAYYSCPAGGAGEKKKCAACHTDEVWPKCRDASWKSLHGFIYSCEKDRQGGTDNCRVCHTSAFTTPLCGIVPWERSHSYYPCR